jgi:hypothetical protein
MDYRWEKRDRRFSAITPIIEQMFAGAAEICTGLWAAYPQYRPFHDNENAGVSILLAGAARKELFPVSEFPVEKKTWSVIAKKRDGKRLSKTDRSDKEGRSATWNGCCIGLPTKWIDLMTLSTTMRSAESLPQFSTGPKTKYIETSPTNRTWRSASAARRIIRYISILLERENCPRIKVLPVFRQINWPDRQGSANIGE